MKYLWAVLPLFAFFINGSANAAIPANDDWENRITLVGEHVSVLGSNIDATTQAILFEFGVHSVWYSWTPAIGGTTVISTGGNTFDTTLTIYTGDSLDTLVEVAFNDDIARGNLASQVSVAVVPGVTYSISVDSYADVTGFFGLTINQTPADFSDDFAGATPIVGTSFLVTGDNSTATAETGEPNHAGHIPSKSVWLQWTAPGHGSVKLSTAGSLFDTLVSVYTGTALNNLHSVAQNDNENFFVKTSLAGFTASEGVTYYIAIDGAFAQSGSIKLDLEFSPTPPSIPRLQNQIVLNGNTATFNALADGTGTISYQWERAAAGSKFWVPLSDGTVADTSATDNGVTYAGSSTAILTVTTTADQSLPTNNDQFRCIAIDSIGTTTSSVAKTIVTVLDTIDITIRGTTPGGNPIDLTTGGNTGDTYYSKGLPAGLTLNTLTGQVTGTVTAKPGSYIVTYWHKTGTVLSTPLTVLIQVNPLDSTVSGGFEAILEVPPTPGVPMGKVTLLVNAASGVFTGTLVCADAKTYSMKGALALNATYDIGTASVTINRPGLTPYRVDITLDSTQAINHRCSVALQQLDSSYAVVSLLGQSSSGIQLATFTTASPTPWQGYYTLILDDPTSPPTTPPEGTGFATANINAEKGKLMLRGKLGDGTSITATLPPSADGGYRWYGKPYPTGGFFAGWIQFVPIAGGIAPYQMVGTADSELYWKKSASSSKDSSYRAGFGPIGIAATAQLWVPPASGVPLRTSLHLATSTGLFKAGFPTSVTSSNIPVADASLLPTTLTLNNQNQITVKTPLANVDNFSARVSTTTGLFTTSMTLQDGRKVPGAGVMLQQPGSVNSGDVIGEGYLLVPPVNKGDETVTVRVQFTAP